MIRTLKENLETFLVFLGVVLLAAMFCGFFAYNNYEENRTAVEMAKLGCHQEILPGGYRLWLCPAKDK